MDMLMGGFEKVIYYRPTQSQGDFPLVNLLNQLEGGG
jgi:hypothetical protein